MKDTAGEKLFYAVNYVLLSIAALICLLPILHIVAVSLSDSLHVASGRVSFWPKGWTLEPYRVLTRGSNILAAFKNSVVITVFGTVFSMVCTIMAAYPLSRKSMYARRFFTLAIVFTMLFGAGIIPTFLVMKAVGLVNTYWAIWMAGLISAYNMLVMKTFFEGLPTELEEAARIDGCGEWRLLLQIVLPLSKPMLAALTLFYGVSYWNQFMNVVIFINETAKYNLTVLVQNMLRSQMLMQELNNIHPEDVQNLTPETIKAAGVVVMILPMLVVYPLLQKYFVKGVMIGAIKG